MLVILILFFTLFLILFLLFFSLVLKNEILITKVTVNINFCFTFYFFLPILFRFICCIIFQFWYFVWKLIWTASSRDSTKYCWRNWFKRIILNLNFFFISYNLYFWLWFWATFLFRLWSFRFALSLFACIWDILKFYITFSCLIFFLMNLFLKICLH